MPRSRGRRIRSWRTVSALRHRYRSSCFRASPTIAERTTIESLIGLLWDLGLSLGHSVRTIDECRSEARATSRRFTSMLEGRLVAGPRPTVRALLSKPCSRCSTGRPISARKSWSSASVTQSTTNRPYSLEPNVKESPGGLRDLHVLLWLARALGYGTTWTELARRGLITSAEAELDPRERAPAEADTGLAAPGDRAARGSAGVRRAKRGGRAGRLPGDGGATTE